MEKLELSYEAIDCKPRDFDFEALEYDFEESDENNGKWRIAFCRTEQEEYSDKYAPLMGYLYPLPDSFDPSKALDIGDYDDMMCDHAYEHEGDDEFDYEDFKLACPIRSALVGTTIVYTDGKHYLALTGGGMDFSWEICESYINLGYYPPTHFAQLPQMAGRGNSERDLRIIAACWASLKSARDRASSNLERFIENYPQYSDCISLVVR